MPANLHGATSFFLGTASAEIPCILLFYPRRVNETRAANRPILFLICSETHVIVEFSCNAGWMESEVGMEAAADRIGGQSADETEAISARRTKNNLDSGVSH